MNILSLEKTMIKNIFVLLALAAPLVFSGCMSKTPTNAGFATRIEPRGHCGWTNANRVYYLVNGDRTAAYNVTIKTVTRFGAQQSTTTNQYGVAAGGEVMLGCGDTGAPPPVSYFDRSIVGEVRL
jgi:hypothetical protein